MSVSISHVSFEHHRNALGIAETCPCISWRFQGQADDWEQSAYDIQVIREIDTDSQTHSSNTSQSRFVTWPGDPLQSAEAARVRVRAHGLTGQPSTDWSDWASVETGLIQPKDWQDALPITSCQKVDKTKPKRPLYFRKVFYVGTESTKIQKARLYITALGLFEAEINGQRVGDHVLAPGFQSFKHRHAYETYDVTDMVQKGRNAVGIIVGEGWYAGRLFGLDDTREFRNLYGDKIGALCLLEVTLSDNTKVHIPTNKTWSSNFGPVSDSQIYDGETYDSRQELAINGWSTASFHDDDWLGVDELPPLTSDLVPSDGPPVRKLAEIKPKEIFQTRSDKIVVDFGQSFAGWVKIAVSGPSGTNITLRYAEVIENGEIGTRPLRTADATDHFILNGSG
ncbi:hypothetical protein Forpi1262_v007121 [Fusarium oxysporum f. sp. raphani]|uniref:Alpha-L-rhamnosidase n=1 Tax=Fusarium oxysporum f. sp. raphani TaxID=96318 RepID=A0A8J5PWK9_FUSOX|nr:hypothetical protein Forpi1262_v007121 [Fusarium oxysporum f. sp. raphani]